MIESAVCQCFGQLCDVFVFPTSYCTAFLNGFLPGVSGDRQSKSGAFQKEGKHRSCVLFIPSNTCFAIVWGSQVNPWQQQSCWSCSAQSWDLCWEAACLRLDHLCKLGRTRERTRLGSNSLACLDRQQFPCSQALAVVLVLICSWRNIWQRLLLTGFIWSNVIISCSLWAEVQPIAEVLVLWKTLLCLLGPFLYLRSTGIQVIT